MGVPQGGGGAGGFHLPLPRISKLAIFGSFSGFWVLFKGFGCFSRVLGAFQGFPPLDKILRTPMMGVMLGLLISPSFLAVIVAECYFIFQLNKPFYFRGKNLTNLKKT